MPRRSPWSIHHARRSLAHLGLDAAAAVLYVQREQRLVVVEGQADTLLGLLSDGLEGVLQQVAEDGHQAVDPFRRGGRDRMFDLHLENDAALAGFACLPSRKPARTGSPMPSTSAVAGASW